MSMNLNCRNKKTQKEVSLYQTPTYMSYMIYSNGDGGNKGILYRYEQYLLSTLNGTFKTEDLPLVEQRRKDIQTHLMNLKQELTKMKDFEFFVM